MAKKPDFRVLCTRAATTTATVSATTTPTTSVTSAPPAPLVTLEPARAASNTAAVRSASGEALAAMQRGTVVIKTPAVGTLAAGAGALIDHLPDEVLAVVLCSVDAKTLFVAVPSVSLAWVRHVGGAAETRGRGAHPGRRRLVVLRFGESTRVGCGG